MPRLAPWLVACAAAIAWLVLSQSARNDLAGGDEGYYGTMTRNVLASRAQLVSPSLSPLGPPGDKPPLYPLLLAPFVRAWGPVPAAVRALSVPCATLIAGGLGVLVAAAAGSWTGVFAAALLATLPSFADASRRAAAELPLTALATLALLVLAAEPRSRARAAVAGAGLGLAFLCKLWLVAPAALAALAMIARRDRRTPGVAAALVGTALAVGAAHLVVLRIFAPKVLGHWLYIYLGRSLVERVRGEGYADYWRLPAGMYWAFATRAFVLVLPFVAIGAENAWRRRGEPVPRALLVWSAGLLLLSLFRVKSAGYAYVVMPSWAALAALGVDAIARGVRPSPWPLVAGAALTSPLVSAWGAQGLPLPAWATAWAAAAALAWLARRPRAHAEKLAAAWALLALAFGSAHSAVRLSVPYHTPGYERVAAAIAPRLAGIPPNEPSFVAPEAPAFDYFLFRTGLYWGTPIAPWTEARAREVQADRRLRVFIVDPTRDFYGGWPDSATVRWLEHETTEITARMPPGPHGERPLRVFVR